MKTLGTLAARELLARPRRFERPTFATGAFTHIPSEQNKARCRLEAFRLLRGLRAPVAQLDRALPSEADRKT